MKKLSTSATVSELNGVGRTDRRTDGDLVHYSKIIWLSRREIRLGKVELITGHVHQIFIQRNYDDGMVAAMMQCCIAFTVDFLALAIHLFFVFSNLQESRRGASLLPALIVRQFVLPLEFFFFFFFICCSPCVCSDCITQARSLRTRRCYRRPGLVTGQTLAGAVVYNLGAVLPS